MEKRIDWIDFAKGFTIIFVILYHVLMDINYGVTSRYFSFAINSVLETIVATAIMPIFMAISGYLCKDIKSFKDYIFMIYKKFVAFFIPYIVFNFIIYILLYENHDIPSITLKGIIFIPLGHTWFLYSLFLMFVVWGLMDLLKFNITFKCLFVIAMFIASKYLGSYDSTVLLPFKLTCIFMPYFLLGYLMRNKININILFDNKIKFTLLVIVTTILLYVVVRKYPLAPGAYNWLKLNIVPRIFIVILFFKIFIIFPKNKFYLFTEKMGKISLIIYLVHWTIMGNFLGSFCIRMFNHIGTNDFTVLMGIILSLVIALGSSLFVAWLCRYKVVSWIFFPRRFIDPLVKKTRFGKWIFS